MSAVEALLGPKKQKKRQITVHLPSERHRQLQALAKRHGFTVSAVIDRLCEQWIREAAATPDLPSDVVAITETQA